MNDLADVVDPAATPRVAELRDILHARFAFFNGVVERSAAAFGPAWAADFDDCLERLFPSTDSLTRAASGYARFVMDLLRRQRQFEKDRTYPAKSYSEAAREVYLDEEYMTSEYLPGLLVSHFLWPHHHQHGRFFDSAFVSQMKLRPAIRFAEIGIGTGLYSRRLLQNLPAARGVGFDISPAAQAFTEAHMRGFEVDDRYEVVLQDVVAHPMKPREWLVCIEVLEHLEEPVVFLRALRDALVPGGRAFITAALNAAHVDHIYLYETVEDVLDQLGAAGFAVEQGFVANAYKPATPDLPVPAVAAFIVL